MPDYIYKFIEDLPDNSQKDYGIASMAEEWKKYMDDIKKAGLENEFNKKFTDLINRQWAIETGIIEGIYYIDRGITETLIEKGIDANYIQHGSTDKPAEVIVDILRDHQAILDGLFDFVSRKRELSASYIKELHAAFTRTQDQVVARTNDGARVTVDLIKGDWKKQPNNPLRQNGTIHEYCLPNHVVAEMDNLIRWHLEHAGKDIAPEVEAAWLHHRFTQIHPFQDGNGRVARALGSLIFIRAGMFPLIVERELRGDYIDALESADAGDLTSLINLFVERQKIALDKGILVAGEILSEAKLKISVKKLEDKKKTTFELANKLVTVAKDKCQKLADELNNLIKNTGEIFNASVRYSKEPANVALFLNEVSDELRKRQWHINKRFFSEISINISDGANVEFFILFFGWHEKYDGEIVAISGMKINNRKIDIHNGYFIFSYADKADLLEIRFSTWLNENLTENIDKWRSGT